MSEPKIPKGFVMIYTETHSICMRIDHIVSVAVACGSNHTLHTRRVVAGECAEIAEAMWSDHYWAWPAMQTYAAEIRKKYGVTE